MYPEKCKLCFKAFKSKSGLYYHQKMNHQSQDLPNVLPKCPVCHKAFQGPSFVKRHVRTHKEYMEKLKAEGKDLDMIFK